MATRTHRRLGHDRRFYDFRDALVMKAGITNYIMIAAALLAAGAGLAFFVHPAWAALPLGMLALCLYALSGMRPKVQPQPPAQAADDDEQEAEERILVPVVFAGMDYNFYFDGRGKIRHLATGSSEQELVFLGYAIAEMWGHAPIQLIEHVGRRENYKLGSREISFLPATPVAPPQVALTYATTYTLEENRFIHFFCACGTVFAAAWGHNNWPENNAVRETMAVFLLGETCKESRQEINRLAEFTDGPLKDLERLAQARPEEKNRIFTLVENSVMVPLLRAIPADVAWNCIRDLPLKVRLLLADDIVHAQFPADHEWRRALRDYRKELS